MRLSDGLVARSSPCKLCRPHAFPPTSCMRGMQHPKFLWPAQSRWAPILVICTERRDVRTSHYGSPGNDQPASLGNENDTCHYLEETLARDLLARITRNIAPVTLSPYLRCKITIERKKEGGKKKSATKKNRSLACDVQCTRPTQLNGGNGGRANTPCGDEATGPPVCPV